MSINDGYGTYYYNPLFATPDRSCRPFAHEYTFANRSNFINMCIYYTGAPTENNFRGRKINFPSYICIIILTFCKYILRLTTIAIIFKGKLFQYLRSKKSQWVPLQSLPSPLRVPLMHVYIFLTSLFKTRRSIRTPGRFRYNFWPRVHGRFNVFAFSTRVEGVCRRVYCHRVLRRITIPRYRYKPLLVSARWTVHYESGLRFT